jgi:hypothetical protein
MKIHYSIYLPNGNILKDGTNHSEAHAPCGAYLRFSAPVLTSEPGAVTCGNCADRIIRYTIAPNLERDPDSCRTLNMSRSGHHINPLNEEDGT